MAINKRPLREAESIPFRVSPGHSVHIILQTMILAVLPTLQILAVAMVVDQVTLFVQTGGNTRELALSVAAFFSCIIYFWLGTEAMNFSKVYLKAAVQRFGETRILEKRAKLKYAYIEHQPSLEEIERVTTLPEEKILDGFYDLLNLLSICLQLAGVFTVLLVWAWWIALVILAVCVPLFYLAIQSGKATYQANERVTGLVKRYNYLDTLLNGREPAEERTMFSYTEALDRRYLEDYKKTLHIEVATQGKWYIRLKSGSLAVAVISVLIAGILVQPLLAGAITLGIYISLVNGTMNMVHIVSWQMMRSVDGLAKSRKFLAEWVDVMQMEEEAGATLQPAQNAAFDTLVFEHVRFSYPNTDRPILKDVSMTLRAGKAYGFIGLNGAGKTTLVKILTGLYREYEGSIMLNGVELRQCPMEQLKATFSAVYQDFARYEMSVRDNIALGNVNDPQDAQVIEAAKSIELLETIERLPEKWNTFLGKIDEHGVDISGGEWQRIALARALVNPAPVCIMDEPTAALDPIAESRVYEDLNKLRRDKTTLFISHRLGSMKLMDMIFVLDDGVIAEAGSHEALMARDGLYAEMYTSQKRWYE